MKGLYVLVFTALLLQKSIFANVYDETIAQVEQIYQSSQNHNHSDFLQLDIIKNKTKLKEFLQSVAKKDSPFLDRIYAYYHPVGFIKMVLYKGEKGEQLRLHFWGQEREKVIRQDFKDGWEPIHNHRWNFSSKVLKGKLEIREYVDPYINRQFYSHQEAHEARLLLDKKEEYDLFDIFNVPGKQVQSEYSVINAKRIGIIGDMSNKEIPSGQAYYTDHNTPHQVQSVPYTSTLLLLDPPNKSEASNIFASASDQFMMKIDLEELSKEEIVEQLNMFISTM